MIEAPADPESGLVCGFVLYTIISLVFPPPQRAVHMDLDMSFGEPTKVIDGHDINNSDDLESKTESVKKVIEV